MIRFLENEDILNELNDDEIRTFINNIIKDLKGEEPEFPTRIEKMVWYQIFKGGKVIQKKVDE